MSEEVLEQKLQKIREIGENHAKAKAELSRLEHGRKILLAVLMKKFMINSNTGKLDSAVAQDREARASDEYKAHIDELAKASQSFAEKLYAEAQNDTANPSSDESDDVVEGEVIEDE